MKKTLAAVAQSASDLFGIKSRIVTQKNWQHLYLPSPYSFSAGINSIQSHYGLKSVVLNECGLMKNEYPYLYLHVSNKRQLFFYGIYGQQMEIISVKKIKGRKDAGAIYYASSSPTLCRQVQALLLRSGVQSRLSTATQKANYRPMYHVTVSGSASPINLFTDNWLCREAGTACPCFITGIKQNCS